MGFFEKFKSAKIDEHSIKNEVVVAFNQKEKIDEAKNNVRIEHSDHIEEADRIEAESKLIWLKLKNGNPSKQEASELYQTLDANTRKLTRLRNEIAQKEYQAERKAA